MASRKLFPVEMSPDLREELDRFAAKRGASRADIIRTAVRSYMANPASTPGGVVVELRPELANELERVGRLCRVASTPVIVEEALRSFIRTQSKRESKEFVIELPEDLAFDFSAFREARDWSDRDYVVERAIRLYIQSELAVDSYTRSKFDQIKAEITNQMTLPFLKESTRDTALGSADE